MKPRWFQIPMPTKSGDTKLYDRGIAMTPGYCIPRLPSLFIHCLSTHSSDEGEQNALNSMPGHTQLHFETETCMYVCM